MPEALPADFSHSRRENQNYPLPLLEEAARRASAYINGLASRPVFPSPAALQGLASFDEQVPEAPTDPRQSRSSHVVL